MKTNSLFLLGFLTFFVVSATSYSNKLNPTTIEQVEASNLADQNPVQVNLDSPIDRKIDNEEDKKAKSLEAFELILKVLKDPRCINCHPTDNRPRQGDDQHPHLFNVRRGKTNNGGPVQMCSGCHGEENNIYSGIPGAPHWGLAPISMGWLGLSDYEIGQRFISKASNGQRSPEALAKHMTEDALVLWGWNPGENRKPVQVPFEEFKKAVSDWLNNGAHVPSE